METKPLRALRGDAAGLAQLRLGQGGLRARCAARQVAGQVAGQTTFLGFFGWTVSQPWESARSGAVTPLIAVQMSRKLRVASNAIVHDMASLKSRYWRRNQVNP